ncbi:neck protein [Yersinia phage vB_YenM_636]|nr:neck protein [Yersinia phage vB_YenM_12]QKN86403.1 neck protein [Yersinia phage vB_YenM_22]QKN86494.1 neck protein [Yersinia phage vB_YenM_25]QKN86585.1 neck protein [Yersinia phage vB_YenM_27]QKN86676.1 neck protein [Yersinia phage vB_YenM_39]QKN86767.1 neck protein [Yersinia phage vB_YenM_126]QKN86858.1 neck protein [Yersinia phage vB_YenM_526-1]QKN86949.1 neck protein [Yersinia phage vB_YenM_526-2]QKN87040.1 neck protein [Yersinia phage vB_YenM_531]QKN87132.1 neck protein [Yersinia p
MAKNRLVIKSPNALEDIRKAIGKNAISVGIHADTGNHDGSKEQVTVAQIYWWMEFGFHHAKGNFSVLPRPTLRPTFISNKAKYFKAMENIAKAVMEGNATKSGKGARTGKRGNMIGKANVRQLMGRLGQVVEADVKNAIVSLRTPPNAESTIKQKGSSNPLIDTGQMVNEVRWEFVKK